MVHWALAGSHFSSATTKPRNLGVPSTSPRPRRGSRPDPSTKPRERPFIYKVPKSRRYDIRTLFSFDKLLPVTAIVQWGYFFWADVVCEWPLPCPQWVRHRRQRRNSAGYTFTDLAEIVCRNIKEADNDDEEVTEAFDKSIMSSRAGSRSSAASGSASTDAPVARAGSLRRSLNRGGGGGRHRRR